MNLKQSILKYEKNKKPRNLLNEVSHYRALSGAVTVYAILSNIFLIVSLLLK